MRYNFKVSDRNYSDVFLKMNLCGKEQHYQTPAVTKLKEESEEKIIRTVYHSPGLSGSGEHFPHVLICHRKWW